MKLRAGTEVEKFEEALEREREEHCQTGIALEQTLARREELADDPTAFEKNEQLIRAHQGELVRRALGIARRERDLAAAGRRAEHAAWRQAEEELRRAYDERRRHSRAVADLLKKLDKATAALDASRGHTEEAETKFRALVPSDVNEWSFPSDRDELDWPETKPLLAMLAKGPIQPQAKAEAGLAEAAREQANADREAVRWAVQHMLTTAFGSLDLEELRGGLLAQVPERLHEEIVRRVEVERKAHRERVEERKAAVA